MSKEIKRVAKLALDSYVSKKEPLEEKRGNKMSKKKMSIDPNPSGSRFGILASKEGVEQSDHNQAVHKLADVENKQNELINRSNGEAHNISNKKGPFKPKSVRVGTGKRKSSAHVSKVNVLLNERSEAWGSYFARGKQEAKHA